MDPNRARGVKSLAQMDAEAEVYAAELEARIAGLPPDAQLAFLDAESAKLEAESRARNIAAGFSNGELPRDSSGAVDSSAITSHFIARAGQRDWEANPDGLSGRLVRGYRHWRHKR
jgi:hypothetical protein